MGSNNEWVIKTGDICNLFYWFKQTKKWYGDWDYPSHNGKTQFKWWKLSHWGCTADGLQTQPQYETIDKQAYTT